MLTPRPLLDIVRTRQYFDDFVRNRCCELLPRSGLGERCLKGENATGFGKARSSQSTFRTYPIGDAAFGRSLLPRPGAGVSTTAIPGQGNRLRALPFLKCTLSSVSCEVVIGMAAHRDASNWKTGRRKRLAAANAPRALHARSSTCGSRRRRPTRARAREKQKPGQPPSGPRHSAENHNRSSAAKPAAQRLPRERRAHELDEHRAQLGVLGLARNRPHALCPKFSNMAARPGVPTPYTGFQVSIRAHHRREDLFRKPAAEPPRLRAALSKSFPCARGWSPPPRPRAALSRKPPVSRSLPPRPRAALSTKPPVPPPHPSGAAHQTQNTNDELPQSTDQLVLSTLQEPSLPQTPEQLAGSRRASAWASASRGSASRTGVRSETAGEGREAVPPQRNTKGSGSFTTRPERTGPEVKTQSHLCSFENKLVRR